MTDKPAEPRKKRSATSAWVSTGPSRAGAVPAAPEFSSNMWPATAPRAAPNGPPSINPKTPPNTFPVHFMLS